MGNDTKSTHGRGRTIRFARDGTRRRQSRVEIHCDSLAAWGGRIPSIHSCVPFRIVCLWTLHVGVPFDSLQGPRDVGRTGLVQGCNYTQGGAFLAKAEDLRHPLSGYPLRPADLPEEWATRIPAFVYSLIRWHSNSATAAIMWNRSRPPGVVVSKCLNHNDCFGFKALQAYG